MTAPRTIWFLACLTVGALLAALWVATPTALGQPLPPGCVQQPWWYGSAGRMTTRTICDGPIQADGSWRRGREFYAPDYVAPGYSSCYAYGCTFYPPRYVPVFDAVESYIVTPATVLPDEPGHVGADVVR